MPGPGACGQLAAGTVNDPRTLDSGVQRRNLLQNFLRAVYASLPIIYRAEMRQRAAAQHGQHDLPVTPNRTANLVTALA